MHIPYTISYHVPRGGPIEWQRTRVQKHLKIHSHLTRKESTLGQTLQKTQEIRILLQKGDTDMHARTHPLARTTHPRSALPNPSALDGLPWDPRTRFRLALPRATAEGSRSIQKGCDARIDQRSFFRKKSEVISAAGIQGVTSHPGQQLMVDGQTPELNHGQRNSRAQCQMTKASTWKLTISSDVLAQLALHKSCLCALEHIHVLAAPVPLNTKTLRPLFPSFSLASDKVLSTIGPNMDTRLKFCCTKDLRKFVKNYNSSENATLRSTGTNKNISIEI